jgi:serine/threonine protein kinase
MLKPGSTLHCERGTYTILDKLSEGGMGVLYVGKDESGKRVVVKEPRFLNDGHDDIRVDKLMTEAEILRKLDHEYIVKYVDSRVEEGNFYLVVEYLNGHTWERYFLKKPVNESDAEHHVLHVLNALGYMHDQNVIYRDLKPQNVMLAEGKRNVLIDFGGSKSFYTQVARAQRTIIFTPGWTAPEQQWGESTVQSDVYGAGMVLFFLLTGEPPALYMDRHMRLRSPSTINPKVKKLSDVVLKATNPDPNERYQTVADMANDIQGVSAVIREPHLIYGNRKHVVSKEVTIGRADDCGLVIPDSARFVSRHHARIFERHGKWWIEDVGSVNGTFLARKAKGKYKKLKPNFPQRLSDNDLIALCYDKILGPYVTLKFKLGEGS